ncbi:transmembrane and ubiquitin-like domain-containing protein 2 isoform X2 [Thalassophryne amazonica]|nr:transmembrane and ubiquitin-like domain-containing protein 2 isoform X2 [Thalassophryne amazonica]
MAVCTLTMLDGMEHEAAAAGGVFLLVLALVLAWLSTHVADRGDHIFGTILTAGAHASLIGLGSHDSYSVGSPSANTPEQPSRPALQENKPEENELESERGEGDGTREGTAGIRTDLLLDIQIKQPQLGIHSLSDEDDDDDDDDDDEEDDEEELWEEDKKIIRHIPSLLSSIRTTAISVRLKFLDDTEELAVMQPQDTVGALKSKYFSGRENEIKLIYQGQLLQDPKRTLLSLNVTHNSVIHCHITWALLEMSSEEGDHSGADTGVTSGISGGLRAAGMAVSTSSLVVPVFVLVLAVVWYFRLSYRQFFTAPATISLVGITVFFSFLIFGVHGH